MCSNYICKFQAYHFKREQNKFLHLKRNFVILYPSISYNIHWKYNEFKISRVLSHIWPTLYREVFRLKLFSNYFLFQSHWINIQRNDKYRTSYIKLVNGMYWNVPEIFSVLQMIRYVSIIYFTFYKDDFAHNIACTRHYGSSFISKINKGKLRTNAN